MGFHSLVNVLSSSSSISDLLKLLFPSASLDFLTLSFANTSLNEGNVSSLFKHYFLLKDLK